MDQADVRQPPAEINVMADLHYSCDFAATGSTVEISEDTFPQFPAEQNRNLACFSLDGRQLADADALAHNGVCMPNIVIGSDLQIPHLRQHIQQRRDCGAAQQS